MGAVTIIRKKRLSVRVASKRISVRIAPKRATSGKLYDSGKPTNEDLALQYQSGDKAALNALYEQNRGILSNLTYSYYIRNRELCSRRGVTHEDLIQEGIFSLRAAADDYKPEKGFKFVSYLNRHVKNQLNSATGQRTRSGQLEPLSRASSLNAPIGEDESLELGDSVPDPAAQYELELVENNIMRTQLSEATEAALSCLDDRQREVMHCRFHRSMTLTATAEAMGVSRERIRQIEAAALRRLRYPQSARLLRPFLDHMNSWAYTGTSFNSWKNYGSVQERIIERLED